MANEKLQKKLAERRKKIKERSSKGAVIFPKEGTLRFRVLPTPNEDVDWAVEALGFYLGGEIQGVFSAAADCIGDDCPLLDKYHELKQSKKASDQDVAKLLSPRKKYLVAAIVYSDDRGKEIDGDNSGKLIQIPTGVYTSMLDIYLDPDYSDFTDPDEGFDFKLIRTGKGKQDTEYTILPVPKPGPISKEWNKPTDPLDLYKKVVKPYEDVEDLLVQFLVDVNPDADEDDEEDKPPKRSKKKKRPRRKD